MDSVHGDGACCAGRRYRVKVHRLLGMVVCSVVLVSCTTGKPIRSATPTPVPTVKPQSSPTLAPVSVRAVRSKLTPVSIVVVSRARTLYRILADSNDSRRASNGTYSSHFTKPLVTFYDEDGGEMQATAKTADADGASKVVTLHDMVHVLTADGSTLTCDAFSYDQAHNHIHAWGNVVVQTKQGDTLHGEDLTGDITLRSVHIDG